MSTSEPIRIQTPDWQGLIFDASFRSPLLSLLAQLESRLNSPTAVALAQGRNRTVLVPVEGAGGRGWVVKLFPRSVVRDQAQRSWEATCHLLKAGVPVPRPVAILHPSRSGQGGCFITEDIGPHQTFRDLLIQTYRDGMECAELMKLLERVAVSIRRMHEAGFLHLDLGNQNILLCDGRAEPYFVDLNRGRMIEVPSPRQRARDLSRITLPSDFLRVFLEMYWAVVPPSEFLSWERRYRCAFAIHTATRRWRHPLREARIRAQSHAADDYPAPPDLWVWDSRSAQPVSTLLSRDRRRFYSGSRTVKPLTATVAALPSLIPHYQALLREAYAKPVPLMDRVGLGVDADTASMGRQLDWLKKLPRRIPLLIRYHSHLGARGVDLTTRCIRELRSAGHPVTAAILQDRAAILQPTRWRSFLEAVLAECATHGVAQVELGHAINRVKWGIWSFGQWERMLTTAMEVAERHPNLRLTGPATIDFEYPFLLAAAGAMRGRRWHALSHHLYVDRRGAPESMQGRWFSLLEKAALAKAIAVRVRCFEGDRVIVSEVNWPLRGTGPWSPVTAPYESPGVRVGDPSVDEATYADYMIRYLLIALCSGMVDQVFWWRLAAHGFGLLDDQADPWLERPAWRALVQWLELVGTATFDPTRSEPRGSASEACHFHFERPGNGWVKVVYHAGSGTVSYRAPSGTGTVQDVEGRGRGMGAQGEFQIGGSPLYFIGT